MEEGRLRIQAFTTGGDQGRAGGNALRVQANRNGLGDGVGFGLSRFVRFHAPGTIFLVFGGMTYALQVPPRNSDRTHLPRSEWPQDERSTEAHLATQTKSPTQTLNSNCPFPLVNRAYDRDMQDANYISERLASLKQELSDLRVINARYWSRSEHSPLEKSGRALNQERLVQIKRELSDLMKRCA
jgi:hypothetical protein